MYIHIVCINWRMGNFKNTCIGMYIKNNMFHYEKFKKEDIHILFYIQKYRSLTIEGE